MYTLIESNNGKLKVLAHIRELRDAHRLVASKVIEAHYQNKTCDFHIYNELDERVYFHSIRGESERKQTGSYSLEKIELDSASCN